MKTCSRIILGRSTLQQVAQGWQDVAHTRHTKVQYLPSIREAKSRIGKFWDAYTHGPDILEFHLGSRPWALGAPPHKLGSPSSMPGPMRMKLPTVVHHI